MSTQVYRSNDISAPQLKVTADGQVAPGYIFSTPQSLPAITGSTGSKQRGLLISDADGDLVWWKPAPPGRFYFNLHPDIYNDEPVLVYFDGDGDKVGHSFGKWHVLDASYREISTVDAGSGTPSDFHALIMKSDGTAVVESYVPTTMDLTKYGGKQDATVIEAQIQRVRVSDGAVLFTWHSLDDFPVSDSYVSMKTQQVDYFHLNALSSDRTDPDVLVASARHTSQIFSLNVKTGEVEFKIGGKRPTLKLTAGAVDTLQVEGQTLPFSYQHDVQVQNDGTLSIFDNGNQRMPQFSRAAAFTVDKAAGTYTELNDKGIRHTPDLYGSAQGNTQVLPNGNVLVYFAGLASTAHATEYGPERNVVAEFTVAQSYRVVKYPWSARPTTNPDLEVKVDGSGGRTAYMSWNGATDVASWVVMAGHSETSLTDVATVKKTSFESTVPMSLPSGSEYVQVKALSSAGGVLGISDALHLQQ